ncbi:hypothetical protein ACA910_010962 [Epithemia clementina (nom. ined.)]
MKSQLRTARSIITDSLKVMSDKEEERQQAKEEIGRLQDEVNKTSKRLVKTTVSLSKKDQTLHNKTEEARYHRDRAATLQQQLVEKGLLDELPSTCGTKLQAQQIVHTIRKILESFTSTMKNNTVTNRSLFELLAEMILDPGVHGGS